MKWALVLIAFVETLLGVPSVANAEDTALGELKNHLEQKAPRHWQVHVRWRDGVLLASFMRHTTKRSTCGINPTGSFRK